MKEYPHSVGDLKAESTAELHCQGMGRLLDPRQVRFESRRHMCVKRVKTERTKAASVRMLWFQSDLNNT